MQNVLLKRKIFMVKLKCLLIYSKELI